MKIRIVFPLVICVLLLALLGSAPKIEADFLKPTKIGVLVSLTGSWSTLGKNTVAALQIAANQIAAQTRGRQRFQLLIRDTQLDPSEALDAIRDLNSRGVKIIIEP